MDVLSNKDEMARHETAIEQLCEEFPDDTDFIREHYREVLHQVVGDATIHSYLPILISREVKALIRIRNLTRNEQAQTLEPANG